jgi:hypothetical protein
MSENLIVRTAQVPDMVAAIEGLGVAVESETIGNAEMLTCRKDKASVHIRVSQPSDWAPAPVLRDHSVAVVMMDIIGSLLRRDAVKALRDDVVTACTPFVVQLDTLVQEARANTRDASTHT